MKTVLIGLPSLDNEDGLADFLEDLREEGVWVDGGLSFCDRVMGKGVLKGVWELCWCVFWLRWK